MEFRNKVGQLDRDKQIIVDLVSGLTQEQAAWKPSPNRWSTLEALNHIIDIEVEDFRHDFYITLFTPEEEWPHFDELQWITSRSYNDRNIKESIKDFIYERDKSADWLVGLGNPDLFTSHSGKGFKGTPMRLGDIIVSWTAHDMFHIRQLALLQWDILNKWAQPYESKYSGFYI
ncbi:MAG: DinB family protein [Spirochaetales bacterium]|nr:DinB family protein [Spirochaetales bacterium]